MCFFNRGDTEGTNSSTILCPMFVYVLFYVNLCHALFCGLWMICVLTDLVFFLEKLWFDDLHAE